MVGPRKPIYRRGPIPFKMGSLESILSGDVVSYWDKDGCWRTRVVDLVDPDKRVLTTEDLCAEDGRVLAGAEKVSYGAVTDVTRDWGDETPFDEPSPFDAISLTTRKVTRSKVAPEDLPIWADEDAPIVAPGPALKPGDPGYRK